MNKISIGAIATVVIVIVAGLAVYFVMNNDNDNADSIVGTWSMQSYEGYDTKGVYETKNIVDDPEITMYDVKITKSEKGLVTLNYSGRDNVGSFNDDILLVKGTILNKDVERTMVIIGRVMDDNVLVFAEIGKAVTGESTNSIFMQVYTRNNVTFDDDYLKLSQDWEKKVGYSLGISKDTPDVLLGDDLTITEQYESAFKGVMNQMIKEDNMPAEVVNMDVTGVLFPIYVTNVANSIGIALDETGAIWFLSVVKGSLVWRTIADADIDSSLNVLNSAYRMFVDNDLIDVEEIKTEIELVGTKWRVEHMDTMYVNGDLIERVQDYEIEFVTQYGPLAIGTWTIDGESGENAFTIMKSRSGKIILNIKSDYSDSFDLGYGWFSDDGKLHLTEIYLERTSGDHYDMMAADNTVFVQVDE